MIKFFFVSAICFTFPAIAICQSPVDGFFNSGGDLVFALSENFESYNKYFNGQGTLVNYLDDYEKNAVALYSAFSITDDLAMSISIPYIFLSTTGYVNGNLENIKRNSFQDGGIFLKYRLIEKEEDLYTLTIAPAVGFQTPLTNYAVDVFGLGQGATAFSGRFIIQYKLKNGFFSSAQTGGFYRLNDAPGGFVFDLKYGYTSQKIYIDIWYSLQRINGGTDLEISAPDQFENLGVSYSKTGMSAAYNFNKVLSSYIAFNTIITGKNTGKASAGSAGIIFRLAD